MTVFDGRAARSAVMGSAKSRSFVTILCNTPQHLLASLAGRVAQNRSCTPERLRP